MRIKKFNEMFEEKYDYDKIISILKKTHGWGFGVLQSIDAFESDDEYFKDPIDDNDYAEQFHIYLTDLETGRLRGQINRDSKIRVGLWNKQISVNNPRSIWNQRL